MNGLGLSRFRTAIAGGLGLLFLLAGVFSHGALLPGGMRSQPGMQVVSALFGVAWLAQAVFLSRQRRARL